MIIITAIIIYVYIYNANSNGNNNYYILPGGRVRDDAEEQLALGPRNRDLSS